MEVTVTLQLTVDQVNALIGEQRYEGQPPQELLTEFLQHWIDGITIAYRNKTIATLKAQFVALSMEAQMALLAPAAAATTPWGATAPQVVK